ncbi:MAG: MFS transporter [Gammaproteobacteria bacterium]
MSAPPNMLDTKKGRLTTFGILYICEGIPLGFAAVAIATYMRREGVDVAQVGAFVASFYLPWAFKWAWAPVVDLVTLNRFGGRKAWIVLCQVLMIVTLYFVAQLDYTTRFDLLITMVIIHNVFAATCDVAIDSLAVSSLREDERGQGNGFMFAGAYIGQGLGGGGALFVAGLYGFDVSFLYVAALLGLVLAFVVFFVRDPAAGPSVAERAHDVWRQFRESVARFARELGIGLFRSGRSPLIGVAFALLPIGAMALSGAVSTALQVDLGMTDNQIGQLNIYSMITSGVGCVVGGWLADRLGKRRMLALFYAMSMLPTLWLAAAVGGEAGIAGSDLHGPDQPGRGRHPVHRLHGPAEPDHLLFQCVAGSGRGRLGLQHDVLSGRTGGHRADPAHPLPDGPPADRGPAVAGETVTRGELRRSPPASQVELHPDERSLAVPQFLPGLGHESESQGIVESPGGFEPPGGLQEHAAQTPAPTIVEGFLHEAASETDAAHLRAGEHPAQLADSFSPVDDGATADQLASPLRQPHPAPRGIVQDELGDGLRHEGFESQAESLCLPLVDLPVQRHDAAEIAAAQCRPDADFG